MSFVLVPPRPIILLFPLAGMFPIVGFPMLLFQILLEVSVFFRVPLVVILVASVVIAVVVMVLRDDMGTDAEACDG